MPRYATGTEVPVERSRSAAGTGGRRFAAVLSRVFGRRLTYRVLTGKDGAGFMDLE